MPKKINPNYKPSQRVYELLKAYGVQNPIEFVGHELGPFMLYWEETGKKKEKWDSTCLNWMKRQYDDKRHNQLREFGGLKENIFDDMLDKIQGKEKVMEVPRCPGKPRYKLPEPPVSEETMTAEEALEALAELRKKL